MFKYPLFGIVPDAKILYVFSSTKLLNPKLSVGGTGALPGVAPPSNNESQYVCLSRPRIKA